MRSVANLVVVVLLTAGNATAQSTGAGLYLYQIPTTRLPDDQRLGDGPIVADLVVPDPEYLAAHLRTVSGVTVLDATEERVRIVAQSADTIKGNPVAAHLADSFVIDYREPAVAVHVEKLSERQVPPPAIDDLILYVDEAIPAKTYRRGFDLASQVAASGEGDCTEHAVLLAALARALEMPARVIFGVLLVEHEGDLQSVGHAWTEIHDGRKWRIADATRPASRYPGSSIRYLPLRSLEDEGPGYAMQLLQLSMIQPSRIEQVASALSR